MREDLGLGAWVEHAAALLAPAEAGGWLAALQGELAWEQREIVLYGRRVLQPRLIAWGGDLPYRYSGQTLPARALTGGLDRLLALVCARVGAAFNHVLANRYRDGQDSMGFHADDEAELGPDPLVATLSLGATRTLVVRRRTAEPSKGSAPPAMGYVGASPPPPTRARRKRDGERRRYPLAAGDLFVMGGTCQRHFHHGIPREPRVPAERISLTFRQLLRAPAG
jgi:alkylated DNA repair dioxygenase AlkB